MGSDLLELRCSPSMLSCFGHQSRFVGFPPENGHLLWSSMVVSSGGLAFRLEPSGRNLRKAVYQGKLTLMIATIRLSDDKRHTPATSLLRRAGAPRAFRTRR